MKTLLFSTICAALSLTLIQDATAQAAVLREGDMVQLSIRGVPDSESAAISGNYRIDQGGRLVGLPHLEAGGVQAAGLTEGQLAQRIASYYREAEIFTKATVTILVDRPEIARRVTVGGRVNRQGAVNYFEGMTAFDAFTEAGGADRFGQIKRVIIIRDGRQGRSLDLTKNEDKQFRLLPGDTLEVDRKKAWEP